jgi:hypothetical protein
MLDSHVRGKYYYPENWQRVRLAIYSSYSYESMKCTRGDVMRYLVIAGISVLAITAGCGPWIQSRGKKTSDEQEPDQSAQVQPSEQSTRATLTILDTINKDNEVALTDADFVSFADPAPVAQHEGAPSAAAARFRIQVFASGQIETLRAEKKKLESRLQLPTYIAFESPYYKLYAGDFATRAEAEARLPQVRKLGYTDAWIVRTKALSE